MNKKFSWRSFISFGLFFSFFIILFSGIILYLAPAGRVANWTNWKLIGFNKTGWQSIHTIFSYTFVILSIFHLFYVNWKTFWSYVKSRARKGLNKTAELISATLVVLVIFFGVVYKVPPFQTIMDWGEQLTESWEKEETSPPIPHAESYSLEKFAADILNIPADSALRMLRENNIRVDSMQQTLSDIGASNLLAPVDIFALFGTSGITVEQQITGKTYIPEGNGIGRMSLQQIGSTYHVPVDALIRALEDAGLEGVSPRSVLKDLAEENRMTPTELLEILNNRDE